MSTSVVKRDGRREAVSFDKILRRVTSLSNGLDSVDCVRVAQRVVAGVHDGVHTRDLDELAAETAAALAAQHPEYGRLAARVAVSNLHKQTLGSVSAVFTHLSQEVADFATAHLDVLDAALRWDRDLETTTLGSRSSNVPTCCATRRTAWWSARRCCSCAWRWASTAAICRACSKRTK